MLASGESHEKTVVRLNCLHVRAAVEGFAVLNDGEYPEDTDTDRTPCGSSVSDLLPRGHLCRNPYTEAETTPVDHSPVEPGEIGYSALQDIYYYRGSRVRGRRIGYVISGHGAEEIVCVINSRGYASRDALVIQNCFTVERAVRLFAWCNDGWYPGNLSDVDCSTGKTLIDYLPERDIAQRSVHRLSVRTGRRYGRYRRSDRICSCRSDGFKYWLHNYRRR